MLNVQSDSDIMLERFYRGLEYRWEILQQHWNKDMHPCGTFLVLFPHFSFRSDVQWYYNCPVASVCMQSHTCSNPLLTPALMWHNCLWRGNVLDDPRLALRPAYTLWEISTVNPITFLGNAKRFHCVRTSTTDSQSPPHPTFFPHKRKFLKAFSAYCLPNGLEKLFICYSSMWEGSRGDPSAATQRALNEAAVPGVTGYNSRLSPTHSGRKHKTSHFYMSV